MRAVIAVAASMLVLPRCGGGAEGGATRFRIDARTHPDVKSRLPPYLGPIASTDGGRRRRLIRP